MVNRAATDGVATVRDGLGRQKNHCVFCEQETWSDVRRCSPGGKGNAPERSCKTAYESYVIRVV